MRFSVKFSGFIGVMVATAIISSCATLDNPDTAAEALPLDQSASDSAPSADDLSVFADLKQEEASALPSAANDSPFYSAVGGEDLGRVAYALYGSRKLVGKLASKNPDIPVGATLSAGQQVFFDLEGLKPHPMYLTKDLLERYPAELAAALNSGADRDTVTVQAGETLQAVSQKLYGTTRYWTEIYLLNRDKLSSFDKVSSGVEVTVVRRGGPAPVVDTVIEEQERVISEPAKITPEAPAIEERLSADVMAPTPEPPKIEEPVQQQAPAKIEPPTTAPRVTQEPPEESFWTGTNIRRVVYVGLILIITFFAFYMTRPSKKQKFDMIDMTTSHMDGGGRPKLSKEDHDRNIVG